MAPRAPATEMAMDPTPPLAPRIRTLSSGVTFATSMTVHHAVAPAPPMAAACSRGTPLRDVDEGLLRNDRPGSPQSVTAGSQSVTADHHCTPLHPTRSSVPSVRGTGPSTASTSTGLPYPPAGPRLTLFPSPHCAVLSSIESPSGRSTPGFAPQPPHRLTRGQRASQGARQTPQPSKRVSPEVR